VRVRSTSRFGGRFVVPGDKSVSHRLALLGAAGRGTTRVRNFSTAADCASTLDCVRGLGVTVTRHGSEVTIGGSGLEAWRAPRAPLDAGNSGSTIRMLSGLLAGRPFPAELTGDESLRRRPMERVAAPLRALGARVETTGGRPPLRVEGGALRGLAWTLEVASAQVKTAVLFAGLQAEGETSVVEPAPSRDHTERWLPAFGAQVARDGGRLTVSRSDLHAVDALVPGDPSSAAFLVAAALVVPDGRVHIDDVGLNPGRIGFLDVLRAMGADVRWEVTSASPEPIGWIEARSGPMTGVPVPLELVPSLIDEVPALAAVATAAGGELEVRGASELRVKESDRIAALVDVLGRLGADVEELPDGLRVRGGRRLRGASVHAQGDHRIAMAAAVAGLAAEGETVIEDGDCIAVSFPEFADMIREGAGA
jgi:3-phosphoshikimate 1-carboxyvinyltransferase